MWLQIEKPTKGGKFYEALVKQINSRMKVVAIKTITKPS